MCISEEGKQHDLVIKLNVVLNFPRTVLTPIWQGVLRFRLVATRCLEWAEKGKLSISSKKKMKMKESQKGYKTIQDTAEVGVDVYITARCIKLILVEDHCVRALPQLPSQVSNDFGSIYPNIPCSML